MSGISLSGAPAPAPTGQGNPAPATPTPTPTPAPSPTPAPGLTGSPTPAPTPSPNPDPTPAPYYSTFQDASLKEYAEKKGWKDVENVVKSAKELETMVSSRPSAPATPDAYKIDAPADLPKGMTYDKDFATAFRSMAHKAGLTQEQAASLHSAYIDFAKQSFGTQSTAAQASTAERLTKAQGDLETAFKGKVGTPAFQRSLELAQRAIRMTDPQMMDALKEAGVVVTVDGKDMVANAKLFGVFAQLGQAMYAEDTLHGAPAENTNPFDAKTENREQQAWLIKNDPAKADMLLKASGNQKLIGAYGDTIRDRIARTRAV